MKNKKTKIIALTTVVIIILFGIYNIVWYSIIQSKYNTYIENMDEFRKNKSYILKGDDGFLYNVKLPDYLSFTGNLGVTTEDGKYALLIWPNAFNNRVKYGVQLVNADNEMVRVMINEDITALNDNYSDIIEKNKVEINELLIKAKYKWKYK